MKKIIIILLIAASVGVTYYINSTTDTIDSVVKSEIEQTLLSDPRFPARPVWWEADAVLAVGIVKDEANFEQRAQVACDLIAPKLTKDVRVELYDVLAIQESKTWTLLAKQLCKPL